MSLLLFGCRRQPSLPSRDDAVCRDFPRLLLDRIVTTHVAEIVRDLLQIFQMKEMWAAPEHLNLQGWQG
ncbi:hypothetical protein R3P38DRAFT_2890870 [Favolaschia claudopus]|uniref:Uncharacterized protein n=1 Tax=Favolaschia claudopus TaxID=2862362 RepID=A0AAW0CUB4_9AGAR